jgi:hypothetical protein
MIRALLNFKTTGTDSLSTSCAQVPPSEDVTRLFVTMEIVADCAQQTGGGDFFLTC